LVLPEAVKAARYPGGRPQFGLAAARAASAAAKPAVPTQNAPAVYQKINTPPSPEKNEISPCTPVNPTKLVSPQQLAGQQSASIQDKYLSILALKSLIQKALRAIS
jgi:hypothetical protein